MYDISAGCIKLMNKIMDSDISNVLVKTVNELINGSSLTNSNEVRDNQADGINEIIREYVKTLSPTVTSEIIISSIMGSND